MSIVGFGLHDSKIYCFPMLRVYNVHVSTCNSILPLSMETVCPSNQRTILEIRKMLINVLFNMCCITLKFYSQKSKVMLQGKNAG